MDDVPFASIQASAGAVGVGVAVAGLGVGDTVGALVGLGVGETVGAGVVSAIVVSEPVSVTGEEAVGSWVGVGVVGSVVVSAAVVSMIVDMVVVWVFRSFARDISPQAIPVTTRIPAMLINIQMGKVTFLFTVCPFLHDSFVIVSRRYRPCAPPCAPLYPGSPRLLSSSIKKRVLRPV